MGTGMKVRLVQLNKKQIDVLEEVRKRGYPKLGFAAFNRYFNGREITPQGEAVMKLADKIISEWEKKK